MSAASQDVGGDESVSSVVERLYQSLDNHLLINLVAPQEYRRTILDKFDQAHGEAIDLYWIDAVMHDHGDLVDTLEEVSRADHREEARSCIVVERWRDDLVDDGRVDTFHRWLGELEKEKYTLVLGTEAPLTRTEGERLRRLIPTGVLANMHINRPMSGVSKKSIAKAFGVGALAMGALALPAMVASGVTPREKEEESEKSGLIDFISGGSWRVWKDSEEELDEGGQVQLRDEESEVEIDDGSLDGANRKGISPEQEQGNREDHLDDYVEAIQALSLIDGEVFDENNPEHLDAYQEVGEFFLKARQWRAFLEYLGHYDRHVLSEARQAGYELEGKVGQPLGLYLIRVGYEPSEFASSLFRASDLVRLFPEFNPESRELQRFLEEKFQVWENQGEVSVNKVEEQRNGGVTKSGKELSGEPIQKIGASQAVEIHGDLEKRKKPVRQLYQSLKELDGEEALGMNLQELEDYQKLVGPMEPRFCEWVYKRLESRQLVDGLAGQILRSSDLIGIANMANISSRFEELSWPESLREVLSEIGVEEPGLPPQVDTGLREIRNAESFLKQRSSPNIETQNYSYRGRVISARRGVERLLKLQVTFLWECGLNEAILEVIIDGKEGFEPGALGAALRAEVTDGEKEDKPWLGDSWRESVSQSRSLEAIQGATAGVLNHLLRCLSLHCKTEAIELPFLRRNDGRKRLWPRPVFERMRSLVTSLNKLAHDGLQVSDKEYQKIKMSLPEKLTKVVNCVDDQSLRVPQPVQFFRRHDDNHGIHYEGYTSDNQRLWFYEVDEYYELGEPYLFLAATNPSAVDVKCVHFPSAFMR